MIVPVGKPGSLEELLRAAQQLYSLPAVALEVVQLADDPQIDAQRLCQTVERDPALVAKILRVVNGSLYGLSHRVRDLSAALALLGVKPLKLLVLGFSLPDALFRHLAGDLLRWYWQRTLTRAVAAREISRRWRQSGENETFLVALLGDVGQLVFLQYLADPYVQVVQRVRTGGAALLQVERRALGYDHLQVTAGLLQQWLLPDAWADAVAALDPDSCAPARDAAGLARTLWQAEQLVHLLVERRQDRLPLLLVSLREDYQVGGADLNRLVQTIEEQTRQLAELLSLELPTWTSYTQLLSAAHAALCQTAEEVSGEIARQAAQGSPPRADDETELVAALSVACRPAALRPTAGPPTTASSPTTAGQATTAAPSARRPGAVPAAQDEAPLLAALAAQVAACRAARRPLSLVLVELDRAAEMTLQGGLLGLARRMEQLSELACAQCPPGGQVLQVAEACVALVLPQCDRESAVRTGQGITRQVRQLDPRVEGALVTASVGAATVTLPPRNFPSADLWTTAKRCLSGARACGGNQCKSLEIY